MRLAALAAVLMLAAVAPAWAQENETGPAMITGMWTGECDDVEPTTLTFDQAMSLPRDQIPRCVAVEGLWGYRVLHRDMAARYGVDDQVQPSSLRFGVYQPPDAQRPETPVPARLIGKVGDCDDIRPDIWMGGFCHYGPGRILILGRSEILGPTPDRWVGAEARAGIGEFIEPTSDWPHRAHVEGVAAEWLALVRAGDAKAYADRFHSAWIRLDLDAELESPDSVFHELFVSRTSTFARLREAENPRLRVWRTPTGEGEPGEFGATACYALGDWTDDRWPVSSRDAENMPGRPYVCVFISHEQTEGGGFSESIDESSYPIELAEPVL